MSADLETVLENAGFILTEGAIVERLKNEHHVTLDEHINHAGLIYDARGDLATLYQQYVEIARDYRIPIMLMTPTRKVNLETLEKSAYRERGVIPDCCTFLHCIRKPYPDFAESIFIGGLLGCRGNAYQAGGALARPQAYAFHKAQVDKFRGQNLDFLFAGIMPAVSEAIGMAQAMAESGLPYIISFMIRRDGRLLDGTAISEAMRMIDDAISPRPLCYMANCVHPSTVKFALTHGMSRNGQSMERFIGIQANASSLSPEELDQRKGLHQENFDDMIRDMRDLQREFGFKIFGGCCGTDDRFMEKLAQMLRRDAG